MDTCVETYTCVEPSRYPNLATRLKELEFEELLDNSFWQSRVPSRLERLLLYSVHSQNITQIQELLEVGADVNHRVSCYRGIGSTYLHCAIGRGYGNVVETLLKCGKNVDLTMTDERNHTACYSAYLMGHLEIVNLFPVNTIYTDVISVVSTSPYAYTHIDLSAPSTNVSPSQESCQPHVDEPETDYSDLADLEEAVNSFFRVHSLHDLAKQGYVDQMEDVLRDGDDNGNFCEVHQRDGDNLTALHHAVRNGRTAAAQLLIKHGADLSQQDPSGISTLAMAVRKHCNSMITLLSDTCQETDYLLDGIHEAAFTGYAPAIRIISAKKSLDVNFRPYSSQPDESSPPVGHTLLSISVHYGNNDVMVELLKAGGDPNRIVNHYNLSIVHLALRETIEIGYLLRYKPRLNTIEDSTGGTALHRFARWNRLQSAVALVYAGADLSVRDRQGMTPAQVADQEGLHRFSEAMHDLQYKLQEMCLRSVRSRLPADLTEEMLDKLPLTPLIKLRLMYLNE